jgi:hypothetical protein
VAYDNEEYFVRHYRRNETTVSELKRRLRQTVKSKKPFIRKGHDLFAIKIARIDNSSTKHTEYTKENPKRCEAVIHHANPRLMVLPSDIIRDSGGYVDIIFVEKKPLKADETPQKVKVENKPEIATQTEKWTESDDQFKTENDLIPEKEIDREKEVKNQTENENEENVGKQSPSKMARVSKLDSKNDMSGNRSKGVKVEDFETEVESEDENTDITISETDFIPEIRVTNNSS